MQTFSNELVNLKKQQFQPRPPYQQQNPVVNPPYQQQNQGQAQGNRQPFQGNAMGYRQNINQRPFRPYNPTPLNAANLVKDIVPMQNNLAADFELCYPCSEPHNQSTCTNGVINQALMVQNTVAG